MRRFSQSQISPLLLALIPCVVMVLCAQAIQPTVERWHGDVLLYSNYAGELLSGKLPYRDFAMEYPPLALIPFVLPHLFGLSAQLPKGAYRLLFLLQSTVTLYALALAAFSTARAIRRGSDVGATIALTLVAFLLSPLLPWRFDLFPALLVGLALLALVRGQPAGVGMWLGFGTAAKLYPVVLGPVIGLAYIVGRRWRALGWLLVSGFVALVASVLPFWLYARSTLLSFLTYHQERGIQIESLTGGIICLGDALGLTEVEIRFGYGAWQTESPWVAWLLPWTLPSLALGFLIVLGAAFWRFRADMRERGSIEPVNLILLLFAALLVFIVTNKVFSPQYLIWLLPFVVVLPRGQMALFAAICAATTVIFPLAYDAMLALEPWVIWLLNVRNMATVVLLIWVITDIVRGTVLNTEHLGRGYRTSENDRRADSAGYTV